MCVCAQRFDAPVLEVKYGLLVSVVAVVNSFVVGQLMSVLLRWDFELYPPINTLKLGLNLGVCLCCGVSLLCFWLRGDEI